MLHFLLQACFGACYARTTGADEWDDLDDGDQAYLNACGVVFFLVALTGYTVLLVAADGTAAMVAGAVLAVDAAISLGFHAYKLLQANAEVARQSSGPGPDASAAQA
eukprot:SAG22_NODE_1_length_62449_cov_158.689270_54_plen_107_part_00